MVDDAATVYRPVQVPSASSCGALFQLATTALMPKRAYPMEATARNRRVDQGGLHDRDVHADQHHVPPASLVLDRASIAAGTDVIPG